MPRHAQTSTQQDHRTDQATTQPHAHATPIPPVAQAARSGSAPPVPLPLPTDTLRQDHAVFAPTAHADAPLHPLRSCSTSDPDDPCAEAMPRHAQTSTQQDHRTDEATRCNPPVRETWPLPLRTLCFLPHHHLHRFPTPSRPVPSDHQNAGQTHRSPLSTPSHQSRPSAAAAAAAAAAGPGRGEQRRSWG